MQSILVNAIVNAIGICDRSQKLTNAATQHPRDKTHTHAHGNEIYSCNLPFSHCTVSRCRTCLPLIAVTGQHKLHLAHDIEDLLLLMFSQEHNHQPTVMTEQDVINLG